MKLDIPEDQFGALVGAAVMQTITQDNRDTLIKEAIQHLLTPPTGNTYGAKPRSPLQSAFDYAVSEKARVIVGSTLDGMLAEKVEEVVKESLMKAFENERRATLIDNIADAIVKGFGDTRY